MQYWLGVSWNSDQSWQLDREKEQEKKPPNLGEGVPPKECHDCMLKALDKSSQVALYNKGFHLSSADPRWLLFRKHKGMQNVKHYPKFPLNCFSQLH